MTLPKINTVSSNTLWFLLFTGLKTLSTLAAVMFLSRHLNTHDFGTLNFLLSIFMYSAVFDSLAHSQIIKKIYLGDKPPKYFLKSLYLLSFLLSMAAITSLALFGWLTIEKKLFLPFLVLISGLAFKTFLPLSYIYDAHLKSKISSFSLFTSTLISQLAAIFIVLKNPSILYLCIAYGSQPFLHAAFLLAFRSSLPEHTNAKSEATLYSRKKVLLDILKASLPLFTATLLIQSISRIDALMIKYLLSYEDYGFFSIAVRLTDPNVLLSSALCISIFPTLLSLHRKNSLAFQQKLFKYNTVLLILSALIILPVLALSGFTIKMFFGPRYESSADILNIYIFCLPFLFLHNLQSVWEVIKGYQKLFIYRALLACTTNVLLNYMLIPLWGLKGAAVATVLSYFTLTILSNIFHPKLRVYLKIQLNMYKQGNHTL